MKNETNTHAKASPSDYRRWSACAGAITLEQQLQQKGILPPDESSPAAAEGTRLHDIAERILSGEKLECPPEIQGYVDYCNGIRNEGGIYMVEEKVPLFYSKEETGTVDYAVLRGEELFIVDLKTGRLPIKAEGNHQLLIYAMGLVTPDIKVLHMTIYQFDRPVTWVLPIQEANAICKKIAEAAKLALDDSVTQLRASTDACRWCRCKSYCTEHTKDIFDIIDEGASSNAMQRITDSRLVWILSQKKKIKDFLDSVEDTLYKRAVAGESIVGVQIKSGRKGSKAWRKDIDPIKEMLSLGLSADQATKTAPITPTQASAITDIPEFLWEQSEGKPQIVADSMNDVVDYFEEI